MALEDELGSQGTSPKEFGEKVSSSEISPCVRNDVCGSDPEKLTSRHSTGF